MAVMSNEILPQNGAASEPQNENNDTGRAMVGKIAWLPADISIEKNAAASTIKPFNPSTPSETAEAYYSLL